MLLELSLDHNSIETYEAGAVAMSSSMGLAMEIVLVTADPMGVAKGGGESGDERNSGATTPPRRSDDWRRRLPVRKGGGRGG